MTRDLAGKVRRNRNFAVPDEIRAASRTHAAAAGISTAIQAHRAGSGIVSEKSFLSYYKSVFLRAFGRSRSTALRARAARGEARTTTTDTAWD
jgi:hypothetical protein